MDLGERHRTSPQWVTSSRLLRLGEAVDFDVFLPDGAVSDDPVVFERYLERVDPGGAFSTDGDLSWLDGLEPRVLPLEIVGNHGSLTYRPMQPGSYLARWRVGSETLYRYFAVIEDDWLVVRFSTGVELDPRPNLHATGIPLDYRLPVVRVDKARMSYAGSSGRFDAGDPLFQALLGHHRLYGDAVIPQLPDTPDMDVERRAEYYGGLLEVAGGLLPDPDTVRSARVSMRHPLDTGYTKTFARLRVNDHCGLEEANTAPWLGMPEFPYFASPVDCRKVDQGLGGEVVAHQWDFCGGWHFLGPTVWHREMSEGRWDDTERCIRQGVAEALNSSRLSGHPAFLYPLYDGVYERGQPEFEWVERLQELLALRLTKEYPLAFARSLDIADYFRRHFPVTPTTVFVSSTDHLEYDRHWLVGWNNHGVGVTHDRLPWETRTSELRVASRSGPVAHLSPRSGESPPGIFKDPLSTEYILVEDQRRQVRFERACPLPVWYFDYTEQDVRPEASGIAHTVTPDVYVGPLMWERTGDGLSTKLSIASEAAFPNYALALWGLPDDYDPAALRIETTAGTHLLASNTNGEHHLVLLFDLEQGNQAITIRLMR